VQSVGNPTFSNTYSRYGTQSVYFNNPTSSSSMSTNYYTANTASRNVPLSVAFWINTDLRYYMTAFSLCGPNYGIGANAAIQVDIFPDGNVHVALALPSNIGGWTVILDSSPVMQANVWCHIALTVSSTYTAKLYVDGALTSSQTGTGPFPSSLITNMAFGTSGDGGRGYNGYMSGFGLYYTELSAAEVKSLYTSGGK
jgi:hypothetical protein